MHISSSSILGIVFLGLSIAATYTMFRFWGYEYDDVKKKSSCPQWKMNIHRGIGFAYVLVYILMMTEMVPRLWEYQVEFPVRTVMHILLGTTIGVILIIKISIIRFFRHFEEWMPVLGVSLLLCSVLLGVMSLPAFFSERALADSAIGGGVYSAENRARVAGLLPNAGYPEGVELSDLSTASSLVAGRRVLLDKCVACHDLKTVITRPRTPEDWVRTSRRMVHKPTLGVVISEHEGQQAAAYLIAITPDLQRSAKSKRADGLDRGEARRAAQEVLVADTAEGDTEDADDGETDTAQADVGADAGVGAGPVEGDVAGSEPAVVSVDAGASTKAAKPVVKPVVKPRVKPKRKPFDMAKAKSLYEEECSLCHSLSDVNNAPPGSRAEVNQVLRRMIENGLDLDKSDLSLIRGYMVRKFAK